VSLKIRGLEDQCGELRDEIAGRERKLAELKKEAEKLPKKREALEKEALKTLIVVLGRSMNELLGKAALLAPAFMRLHRAIPNIGEADSIARISSTAGVRRFEPPILVIPRICFKGEDLGDFFHEDSFLEDFQREAREWFDRRREEARQKVSAQRGLS
jgi:hypothetical protein